MTHSERQHLQESSLKNFSIEVIEKVDNRLNQFFSQKDEQVSTLVEAMSYSTLGGGKRVRPLLCLAAARLFDRDALKRDSAIATACSVEFIHAYSLVHDDLPAMDDDDLRRGRPTTHKKYDEATAILAGDSLQTLAFEVLANETGLPSGSIVKLIRLLARASGKSGMVGGQAIDIQAVGNQMTLDELIEMHGMKTGALIRASVLMGAVAGGCQDEDQLSLLDQYAKEIGLAFQIQDDILDCTSSTEVLGKQQGADVELDKPTYVSLLGLDGARQKLAVSHSRAVSNLKSFGENTLLEQLADYIVERTH